MDWADYLRDQAAMMAKGDRYKEPVARAATEIAPTSA
jgi:hypothetical protein